MVVGLISFVVRVIATIIGIFFFIAEYNMLGPVPLFISILVALFALKLVGILGIRIKITLWSILFCILFGIVGLLAMMVLSVTGIAFKER